MGWWRQFCARGSISIAVAMLCLYLIGCAGRSTSSDHVHQDDKLAPPSGKVPLETMLSDSGKLLSDSEFSVVYPYEEHPGVRSMTARAHASKVNVSVNSSRKRLKDGSLDAADYEALLALVRQLDEQEFSATIPKNCREPYNFRLRVAGDHRVFVGCRGAGGNASVVSRLAREVEFRLLKGHLAH